MTLYTVLNSLIDKIKDPPVNLKSKISRGYYMWCFYRSTFLLNVLIKLAPLPKSGVNKEYRRERIIASLTSYPGRIDVVYYAIKSIMLQTCKPDRIILWLAESQFPEKMLPSKLLSLQKKGLEIKYCEDLRSHKKYFHALQEQKPDELIITFDDDIIYNTYTIERAIKKHQEFPKAIVANYVRKIFVEENGMLGSYSKWGKPDNKKPSMEVSPLTGSGCLYPYGCMPQETFRWDIIQQDALNADDIWIGFMSKILDTPIVETDMRATRFSGVGSSQDTSLYSENGANGGNDKVIDNLSRRYPEVVKKIINAKKS